MNRTKLLNHPKLWLRLVILLIHRKEKEIKFREKTFTKLAKLTGRRWWLTIYLTYLIYLKPKARIYYFSFKKKIATSRVTYLEERVRKWTRMEI